MPIDIAIGTSLKINDILKTSLYIPKIGGYFFIFFRTTLHYNNMFIHFLNKDTLSQKKKTMETRMTSNNPSSIIYWYVL